MVARRYRRDDHHAWRAWPEFPHLKSVRTARVDRCDLPDGLCRFICDQPRADLLALNRRDLSAENSRPRRGHGGYVQLGLEPDRFAHVSDIGRETRCQFDIPALCVCLGGVVALRLLFCSGNQGADRKSTRLNSSHVANSYAVFCLKKKKSSWSCSCRSRICFCKFTISPVLTLGSLIWFAATLSWRRKTAWRMPSHHFSTIAAALGGAFCSSHEETNRSSGGESVTMKALSEAASSGRRSLVRMRTRISPSATWARISRQFCSRRNSRASSSRNARRQSMAMSCRGGGAGPPTPSASDRSFDRSNSLLCLGNSA